MVRMATTVETTVGGRETSDKLYGNQVAAKEVASTIFSGAGNYTAQIDRAYINFVVSDDTLTDAEVKAHVGHRMVASRDDAAGAYRFRFRAGEKWYFWGDQEVTLTVTKV